MISTFPPDRGNLAEYGFHLCQALSRTQGLSQVVVLANKVVGAKPESQEAPVLTVRRVWELDRPASFYGLLKEAKALRPDIVLLNAGIRTWGKSRQASLAGAALPLALKQMGLRVVTTLHTIGDTVRLDRLGIDRFTRMGMRLASHLYLQSDVVTVTMPSMMTALQQLGATNVAHLSHGTWGPLAAPPLETAPARILSFGFWGAFKDAELLVSATREVRKKGVDVELVLGGGPHPYFPETYQQLVERFRRESFVRFTGYVPEWELEALFTSASVVVLPYRTNAGASGVLNLCRSFARPVIISNEAALLEQLRFEGGGAIVFDDWRSLTEALERIFLEPGLQRQLGEANLAVAKRVTFQTQTRKLVRLFGDVVAGRGLEIWGNPAPMHAAPPLQAGHSTVVSWPPL